MRQIDMLKAENAALRALGRVRAVLDGHAAVVMTDPNLHDNPIIYASQGFLDVTGYCLEEVLGRNCRMMQGPLSNVNGQIDTLRQSIACQRDCSVTVINYCKSGVPLLMDLLVTSVKSETAGIRPKLYVAMLRTPAQPDQRK
jgi:PAS domain-containing protein